MEEKITQQALYVISDTERVLYDGVLYSRKKNRMERRKKQKCNHFRMT